MGEGQKFVTENFPVEKLPEELKRGLSGNEFVRVTLEPAKPTQPRRRPLSSFVGAGKGAYPTPEDALAEIRAVRDEWE
jgi:hypothetical protein